MGSVHNEQLAQGKGTHETFDYVPFSDSSVLSELIRNRLSVDVSYKEKVFPSGFLSSNGGLIFNECIQSVYVDLDRLIESAPLTRKQRAVIGLLMMGYTIQDIADECHLDKGNVKHLFDRGLDVLVKHHTKRWKGVLLGELELKEDWRFGNG